MTVLLLPETRNMGLLSIGAAVRVAAFVIRLSFLIVT